MKNATNRSRVPGPCPLPGNGLRRALLLATTSLTASLVIAPACAQNLPTGGSVAAGSVSIGTPTATQLNITQTSQSAVVNWQSFSIGQGSAVHIQQPNSAAAMLNRVTGGTPSTIAGSLTANGQVYLVNPNGIAITTSGVVDTGGGFVASTLGISDADFQSGKRTFTGNGASAAVRNAGAITVGRGGYAALLGGSVSNSGSIFVPLGQVGLGSGERATLDFSGDGFLQVALPTAAGGKGALIRNSGTIKADGGSVIISAATAREAARNAVNISGLVQARSIGGRSGSIFIGGGAGGNVKVSGRLSATARRTTGGSITVTGRNITLAGATLDVSGKTGGGSIDIGGGRQGQGPLQQADTVTIDSHTVIRADATATGNGGNVVVWSDQLTRFAGLITARGGLEGGNGGQAEVSGRAKLDYSGFTDLSAARGAFGTLLLDPYNVTISSGTNNTGGSFDADTNDSIINVATLQTALGAANVTVTTGAGGAQAGNITVAAPLTWGAATTLTLTAAGAIAINAPISITGAGGLVLTASQQPGITTTGLTFGNGASVDYGATDKGGSFSLNGVSYKLVYSMAQLDAIDGVNAVDGTALTPYGAGLAGSYALATNLTAAGTTYTQPLIGTNSSGDTATEFTGQLDGLGHTITGLTINAPGTDYAALLGFVTGANASVSNVGLVGGSVIGHNNIGALAGWLDTGAVVQTSFSSAAVTGTGNTNTGGLIGFNTGTVQSSYAAGPVTGISGTGGLVGWSVALGTITNSYATGAVSGATYTGGLIGLNNSNVSGSYATGAVSGTVLDAGGLIGIHQGGTVNASYATGAVTGVTNTGGLVGLNVAFVQASYATGVVTGTGNRTGGLVGQNGAPLGQGVGTIHTSYATGPVSGTTNTGGLVGLNSPTGTVDGSYATGVVTSAAPTAGGLIGGNNSTVPNAVTNSYWDVQTSGRTISAGGSGAAGLQGTLPTGFSSTAWSTGTGLYPYLNWQFAAGTTPQSLSGIAYQANGTALARAAIAGTVNGTVFAGATGANGYYYLLLPQGSTAQGSGVFIDIAGNAVKANDYVQGAMGSVQNLNLNAGVLNVVTAGTALSSLTSGLASAIGGLSAADLVFSTPGGVLTPNAGTSVSIAAAGAFTIDQTLVVPNALLLTAAGGLTIASTGSLSSSTGNATLVGSTFVNNAGAGAVSAPNGRWLIYSGDPLNDTRGGLAYGFKQYGATYGVTAVAQATGNGVLYTVSPTVGVTGAFAKTYDGSTNAPGSFSISLTGYDQDVLTSTYSNAIYGDANAGTSKTVIATGVAITAATNGAATVYGYATATTASGNIGTITARAITVTADAQSRIYGDANPALTYAIGGSGLVNNDSLSGGLTTSATSATGVGSYGITQGSLTGGGNYALTYTGANLAITARSITVTADAQSRYYGDANTLTYTVGGSGLVNNDILPGSLATSATTATGVGSYAITQGSLTGGSNYALLSYTGANLAVTARPITVTADTQSRSYGDANPTLTYAVGGSGLVNSDSLSGGLTTGATTMTGVGSYGIAQGSLAASTNYALTYDGANLAVTARAITVTANAQSRSYGDTNPTLSYVIGGAGLVNNDNLLGGLTTSAATTTGVGSYGITQGSLAASSNYALTYTGANLAITARAITVTADAQSRVYGNANPTLSYVIGGSGLVNNDSLSGSLTVSATTTTGIGSYGIVQGSLAASTNYALTYDGANLAVTARAITVTANAQSRVYGNANPTLSYVIGGSGLVNNDSLSGSLTTSATTTTNIGSYGIAQGSLAASTNYALTYTGANLAVTARAVTVTANAQSRVYGNANPTLTYVIGGSGLVNNDSLSGGLTTSATTTTNIGSYGIAQGSLAASTNYALTYDGANLAVTARAITVTANAQSRTYGDINPTLSYVIGGSGLVNNDSLSGSLTTSAVATTGVGSYGIVQGSLAGGSNYALTYSGANLAVTARAITVTADAQTRVYGNANPTLTYVIGGSGLVNNDSLTGSLTTGATPATGVGSYGIVQGSLTGGSNYALTYSGANLAVTARAITVTADAQTRVYGNANPTLTFAIGGSGLVNNDSLSGSLSTSATTATGVGGYGITQGSLTGGGNYALTYTGANLAVTARPITVTADAQSRSYGDANPALTFAIGGSGLVNSDSLSGGLTTSATSATTATGVGSYGIAQGSLAGGGNYALTYTGSNLAVTARAITVMADAQSRSYGDTNPTLTYTVGGSGLVNNDSLSGGLTTSATTATGVGGYGITQGSLAAGGNYALTYTGANLAVTARAITVTADAQSRMYGDANPVLTYAIGGSGLVNNDSLTGGLTTNAIAGTGVGSYGIAQGSLAAGSNYALTYTAANLAVTARPITVTADAQSRVFGDANPVLTYSVGAQGLVNGDTLAGSLATDATPTAVAGTYAITQGTLVNAINPNYAIAYAGANLLINAAPPPPTQAEVATPVTSPFIVAAADTTSPTPATINLQLPQSTAAVIAAVIAPPPVPSGPVATAAGPSTQAAMPPNSDDDIVTGSIAAHELRSADGFVYKPLSQYDAAQYSGDDLPGYESQTGEAAILTMLLRGALGANDTPKIDNLFEPGKGLQWSGVNWDNSLAGKISFSDAGSHTGAPGEGFAIQAGTTDLAAMLGKGPVILIGSSSDAPAAAPFPLLGVAMTAQGIAANDPVTGLQVLISYDSETKTLGSIVSVFDPKTGASTRLADVMPNNAWRSQDRLDQLAKWSAGRFAAVSVPH